MRINGFSLFELLLTMAIVCSMLLLAAPSYQWLSIKTREQTLGRALWQAIHLARSEAMMRGFSMTLCHSIDQKTCSGSWSDGFLVNDGQRTFFSYHNDALRGVLHWRSFPQSKEDLQFSPSGFLYAENGSFWFCHYQAVRPSWAIVINQSGRARWISPDKKGVIDMGDGETLHC